MSKIKSVSTYNGISWEAPTPLGANIENIDITSSVHDAEDDTMDTIESIQDSVLAVSANPEVGSPDTGASAWTKFNTFRKRVGNVLSRIGNQISNLNQQLTTKQYVFNNEWLFGFYGIASGQIEVHLPCPPLATGRSIDISNIEIYIPNYAWQTVNLTNTNTPRASVGVTPWGYVHIIIPISMFSSDQQAKITSAPGHFLVRMQGSITFS